jgi:hypothetical protein
MSQLVGHFANVLVGHNWRDGDEIIIAKIMRQEGQKFIVRAKHGKEYNVVISDIKELVNVTARQKFSVGDEVNAEIDYHPLGGPVDDFCEILSVSCFANDVDYTVRVLKTGKTITLAQSHIKEHVYLKTPKYSLNQRIGVKHCDGHPYYYDEYIKNATIISVDPWYDQVNYIIRYDDGKVETRSDYSFTAPAVVKTPAQKEREYTQFLQSEEQRLLSQLENVRAQMRK